MDLLNEYTVSVLLLIYDFSVMEVFCFGHQNKICDIEIFVNNNI